MNPKVTLGLLAVLIALGGYLYFGNPAASEPTPKPGQPAAPKDKPNDAELAVFQFDDQTANRITVDKGGQKTVVERDGDGPWRLLPSGEPADRVRLSGILLRLSNLRATRRFAQPGNLADYGLTTPATTVTLARTDGPDVTLLLGAKAPAEAGTYARKPDDPVVFVIANATAQDLDRLVAEPPREPPTPTPLPTLPPTPAPAEPAATPTP